MEIQITPILWLVGFQMALYAVAWGVCSLLLDDDRLAVAHWGAFMLLLGAGLWLAGARGEPGHWLHYNGSSLLTLLAFVLVRRGTERFMRQPSSDREQLLFYVLVGGSIAVLGLSDDKSSLRSILASTGQAYVVLRMMLGGRRALRGEFGSTTEWAIVVPGLLVALGLLLWAVRQALDFSAPVELQRNAATQQGLMHLYLFGAATFNFGFMVMLTQRLVAKLRQASEVDALTGLFNRRALAVQLDRHWQRQRRGGMPFAVLLADIDHFKRFNDNHGHAAGDLVLAHVAEQLRQHARPGDLVSRYGGEEFLVLLPGVDQDEALRIAERLRNAIEQLPVQAAGAALSITLSVGASVSRSGDPDAQVLIARADAALYRAKAAGRNRVES